MLAGSHRYFSCTHHPHSHSNYRLDPEPGLSPTVINAGDINPDASVDATGAVARGRMIGIAVSSALMFCLVLFGVIFCLRRRVRGRSFRRVVDATRVTSSVSSCPSPSRTVEQRESGATTQDRSTFVGDRGGAAIHDPVLIVAGDQGRCSRPDRCSQVSTSSTISRSIRFAITGSHHSPTNSCSSRATMSIPLREVAHTVNPFADVALPQRPCRVKTLTDHSAPWRGSNLSNIINTARGVKG